MKSVMSAAWLGLGSAAFAAPPIPGVENHWVANSGGNQFDHIQNFIEDMTVGPDGTVYTQSYWDEARHADATYKDGLAVGFNWSKDPANPHPSQRAQSQGVTWNIRNFWGRGFVGKLQPPVADSLPFIEASDGRTIRTLVDPTALAFDLQGRLLVAENGPDQNVKIFDVTGAPKIVGTFGDSGGVFAGPRRGVTGNKRFWGIRGLGMDSLGRLYVGNTGMPMQVGGGTDIRCFSGEGPSDTLLWKVQGLAFVNTVDADPDSGGTSLQKNHTRFHMDWSQPPGKSWSFAAVTSDPFKYPDDPRFVHSLESNWFRRIQGKRFLFLDDMVASKLVVTRFEDNSEIGIPTAVIPILGTYSDSGASWAPGRRPEWGTMAGNDYRRWIWRDDNGDGLVQKEEFHVFNLIMPSTAYLDVDDSGDIWTSGSPYMLQIRAGKLDAHGVPEYKPDSIKQWLVPFKGRTENNDYVMYCRYLRGKDIMLVATSVRERQLTDIYRYDHWSQRAKPFPGWGKVDPNDTLAETWHITVPYKYPSDWSQSLDTRVTDTCLFPNNFTADTDYIYVGYVDKGPDGHRNGEVSVYDIHDGSRIGYIAPGPETNFMSGWFDLWHAINPFTRPNGEKLLMVEEDYGGKVMVYRWKPRGSHPNSVSRERPETEMWQKGRSLRIGAALGVEWSLDVVDFRGRRILTKTGTGTEAVSLPEGSGSWFGRLACEGRIVSRTVVLP